jgi:hypothetical protein
LQKLTRLWRSLEQVAGQIETLAAWERLCADEFALLRPHLRCTEESAVRYPCPNPRDADCPRVIVDYGRGSFAAVCRHPHRLCDDKPVTLTDALVHQLDLASLMKPIARALGVRWQQPAWRFPGVWVIGVSARVSTRSQPVFLQIQTRRASFLDGIRRLLLEVQGPFLLVAPTEQFREASVQELLHSRGIDFISLEDDVLLDSNGRFVAIDPISPDDEHASTPVDDRRRVLTAFGEKYDITTAKIADEAAVDPSDLYKWLRGELSSTSKKSARLEAVLRRGIVRPIR